MATGAPQTGEADQDPKASSTASARSLLWDPVPWESWAPPAPPPTPDPPPRPPGPFVRVPHDFTARTGGVAAWEGFEGGGRAWFSTTSPDDWTRIVTEGSTHARLAVSVEGLLGEGRAALTSWRPSEMTAASKGACAEGVATEWNCPGVQLLRNLFTVVYGGLSLRCGETPPVDQAAATASRVMVAWHPVMEAYVELRVRVTAWGSLEVVKQAPKPTPTTTPECVSGFPFDINMTLDSAIPGSYVEQGNFTSCADGKKVTPSLAEWPDSLMGWTIQVKVTDPSGTLTTCDPWDPQGTSACATGSGPEGKWNVKLTATVGPGFTPPGNVRVHGELS